MAAVALVALLGGCATPDGSREPTGRVLSADEGRAQVARGMPDGVADRNGWAVDIYAAIVALQGPPTVENMCAAIAVIGQESGFQVDPAVPGLPAIARREIDLRFGQHAAGAICTAARRS